MRRLPEKQVTERSTLNAILDAARVAHVGVTDADGQPYVLPVAFARDGDGVLIHGSTGSRLFRELAAGAPTCVTVTLVDGLVLARSAFESSMHYRSAMMFGTCDDGRARRPRAMPRGTHRTPDARALGTTAPTDRKGTGGDNLLHMPLREWSVKVSDGWPDDPVDDLDEPVWAGVLPIESAFGAPLHDPRSAGALRAADLPRAVDTVTSRRGLPIPQFLARRHRFVGWHPRSTARIARRTRRRRRDRRCWLHRFVDCVLPPRSRPRRCALCCWRRKLPASVHRAATVVGAAPCFLHRWRRSRRSRRAMLRSHYAGRCATASTRSVAVAKRQRHRLRTTPRAARSPSSAAARRSRGHARSSSTLALGAKTADDLYVARCC